LLQGDDRWAVGLLVPGEFAEVADGRRIRWGWEEIARYQHPELGARRIIRRIDSGPEVLAHHLWREVLALCDGCLDKVP
jgi:hypothetical protein